MEFENRRSLIEVQRKWSTKYGHSRITRRETVDEIINRFMKRRKRPDTFSIFLENNVSFILCVLFVKKLHGSKLIFLVEMLLPYVYLP